MNRSTDHDLEIKPLARQGDWGAPPFSMSKLKPKQKVGGGVIICNVARPISYLVLFTCDYCNLLL